VECHPSFHLTYDAGSSSVTLAGTISPRAACHVTAACELLAGTAGARAVLDLSDVEQLSASALEQLSEGVAHARGRGVQIVITARTGTEAGRMLAEARIPHLLTPGPGASARAVASVSRKRRPSQVPPHQRVETVGSRPHPPASDPTPSRRA
jgi:anti-anti-sigma regulatory factor